MRKRLTETSVLFISVMKWFVIASITGVLVGGSTALFLSALKITTNFIQEWNFYFLLIPAAFIVSSLLVKYLAPDAQGHGTEKVIEAIHKRSGVIKPLVVPIKLIATVVTLACGGSAGKEGPCAQIGAGIASVGASLLKFDATDRKKLVICGVSAGFATVFGTPVAGAIFGVEVLAIGQLQYAILFPSFVAGIIGYQVSTLLGTTYFHHPITFVPTFSELFFLKVVFAGIAFGITSFIFIEIIRFTEHIAERYSGRIYLKGAFGGLFLIGTVIISQQYLGLGLSTIEDILNGNYHATSYDSLMKMVATSTTLSFGGSGGIVTPIFFIGTTVGSFLAPYFSMDSSTLAALGMTALLAGCANTPIAASIMAIELFGPTLSPYAAVTCIVSFLMVGHRSVYSSQILSMTKSSSLKTDIGKAIESLPQAEYNSQPKKMISVVLMVSDSIRNLFVRKNNPTRKK